MVLNDTLSSAMSKLNNSVAAFSKSVVLKKSKLLVEVLSILRDNGYVGSFEIIEDGKSGQVKVNLLGTINKCGVIKPRSSVQVSELESCERRFLPAKDFGILILSTNKGLLTQVQAKEVNVGGTLVVYCY